MEAAIAFGWGGSDAAEDDRGLAMRFRGWAAAVTEACGRAGCKRHRYWQGKALTTLHIPALTICSPIRPQPAGGQSLGQSIAICEEGKGKDENRCGGEEVEVGCCEGS